MTKFVTGIVCAEMTADGPRQFAVENEAAFIAYVELSNMGSDEAAYWGGFRFDLNPDDEDTYDADGEELDQNKLVKAQIITMAEINTAITMFVEDLDENDDAGDDEYEEEDEKEKYEDAFLAVRDGTFRK